MIIETASFVFACNKLETRQSSSKILFLQFVPSLSVSLPIHDLLRHLLFGQLIIDITLSFHHDV